MGTFHSTFAQVIHTKRLKQRTKAAQQRRTIDFFIERKFGNSDVLETLKRYGFEEGKYTKVIVSWGWTAGAEGRASEHGVELWDFRGLMREMTETLRGKRSYITDDTLRTLHLYSLATDTT